MSRADKQGHHKHPPGFSTPLTLTTDLTLLLREAGSAGMVLKDGYKVPSRPRTPRTKGEPQPRRLYIPVQNNVGIMTVADPAAGYGLYHGQSSDEAEKP